MEKANDRLIETETESIKDIEEDDEISGSEKDSDIKALMDLSFLLNENPLLEHQIKEVFEFYLKGDISSVEIGECFSALKLLIPSNSVSLILHSCLNNSNEFLSEIENIASTMPTYSRKSVVGFIRSITALYGTKIERTYYKNYNDLKWMFSNLYINSDNDYFLELDISKHNNEKLFLKMDLSSTFNFTGRIIAEINKLPKETFSKRIPEETREILITFYKEFFCDDNT